MRCTVFGTGYLGATHAVGMAELGHHVVGVDIDPGKVAKLAGGDIPFYEPGLRKLLTDNLAAGRLRFTTDYDMAAEFADVHFLGVGTPQKKGEYGADLRHVHAVIDALVPSLTRASVLVGKSTVPAGTAAELGDRAAALEPRGVDVEVAWNPEFLREGFVVHDTLHPDRIVLGVKHDSSRAETTVRELYGPLLEAGVPFLVTDLQTAELVKVSANAFLATKISFINAVSEVCEAAGADVSLLADALGYDPRIGRECLNAGLGFGGGCLPKDIRAFMARAGELGANQALTFLREVDSINMRRRTKMVELAKSKDHMADNEAVRAMIDWSNSVPPADLAAGLMPSFAPGGPRAGLYHEVARVWHIQLLLVATYLEIAELAPCQVAVECVSRRAMSHATTGRTNTPKRSSGYRIWLSTTSTTFRPATAGIGQLHRR